MFGSIAKGSENGNIKDPRNTESAENLKTAQRNLFTDFENMDPPVCQTPEFPSPISPEMDLSVYENDDDQTWRKCVCSGSFYNSVCICDC